MHDAVPRHDAAAESAPASAVGSRLRAMLEQLTAVSALTTALLERVAHDGERPTRADLAQLTDQLRLPLSDPARSIDGIGVAMIEGYLGDSDYWLEWWRVDRQGDLEFVAHALNPRQDSFYDYPARTWFTVPVDSGAPATTGPYVDSGGTNAYTITAAVPVRVDGRIVGVAGADIHVSRFESDLLNARSPRPLVLVNGELRVIASTTSAQLPGDLLDARSVSHWCSSPIPAVCPGTEQWRLFLLP